MKYAFLLDENVLIWPIESGGNTQGGREAIELWESIGKNCHTIVVSHGLFAKYLAHLRQRRSQIQQSFRIVNFERKIRAVITGKSKWVPDESSVLEEQYIRDPDDHFLVRIAVRSPGCIFVCEDAQTREGFAREEIAIEYNIRSVRVDEALSFAKET
jgi:predicted nucleic acid-binding protein